MTRRVAAAVALGLVLVGCGLFPERVQLLIGNPTLLGDAENACVTSSASGPLVADPTYGTAILDLDPDPTNTQATPVAWAPGFTGRRVGSEVEVVDPQGTAVALTGHSYRIAGGFVAPGRIPGLPGRAFLACGRVIPQA